MQVMHIFFLSNSQPWSKWETEYFYEWLYSIVSFKSVNGYLGKSFPNFFQFKLHI